jgi:hypothetical protein
MHGGRVPESESVWPLKIGRDAAAASLFAESERQQRTGTKSTPKE